MGNYCSELCDSTIKFFGFGALNSDSKTSSPELSQFSEINNSKFMIPKDYLNIIKQIKDKILIDDTSLWPNYQKFLQNSKAYFNKLLNSLKSYKKLSVIDNIPFETIFQMDMVFPKKYPRKFILEIQKALFFSTITNPKNQGLTKPYIEIEIYPNDIKNPDRVVFFQTKVGDPINNPEWNEVFVYEFELEEIQETGKFLISLYFVENYLLNSKKLIDKKYTFEFPELSNQRINEKIIKLKDVNQTEPIGEIYIRVQMIYNNEKFLADWINEFEVKLEIIERILKINAELLNSPPKNTLSNELTKKMKGVKEESYIEMTTISKSWDEPELNESIKTISKSPLLFGTKPPNLKIEEFYLESHEGSAKDKNEYFDNHFFIK